MFPISYFVPDLHLAKGSVVARNPWNHPLPWSTRRSPNWWQPITSTIHWSMQVWSGSQHWIHHQEPNTFRDEQI